MHERVKPAAPLVIALTLLAASSAGAIAPPGEGPQAVVLHISFDKGAVELNHSYDEQKVSLNGSVLVDYVVLITVHVALAVSTDLGWTAYVVPADMTFVSSVTQFFNATVKVPAGTVNRTAILTVRGNATVPPGIPEDSASDTATITVLGGTSGDGNGTPVPVPHGRPAPTGVFVPPVPLIMGAVTVGAVAFTGYMLWYLNAGPARRPARKTKGGR
jgi:hypothetical protein